MTERRAGPELPEVLDEFADECVQLRMGAALPEVDSATGDVFAALLDVRRRMDRVEELLSTVLKLRAMAARKHTALRISADDAWDDAAVRQRQQTVRDEYSSAKERTAATNLAVLDMRRLERTSRVDLELCDGVVEQIRLRFRGLADLRQDLHSIIKLRQFESTLDR